MNGTETIHAGATITADGVTIHDALAADAHRGETIAPWVHHIGRTDGAIIGTDSDHMRHLFGILVRLAFPLLDIHHADLASDVLWLAKHGTGHEDRWTFFYGADSAGTAIGEDRDHVTASRENVWRVDVYRVGTAWLAGVFPV